MASTPDDTAAEAEPAAFKSRHTVAQKVVLGVNILVVLACFAAAGALMVAKSLKEDTLATPRSSAVTTTSVPLSSTPGASSSTPANTGPTDTFPPDSGDIENFLITGADNNACVDPNSPWAGAADPTRGSGGGSDTIMVLRVDSKAKRAAILSFPRDLWVSIPGRGMGRINSAYVRNEYALLQQTLYDNFGVTVQHYVQLDFCAFKQIVQAVGGVKVPFSTPIRDTHIGLNITSPGCHSFSGDEALAYVRSRHLQYLDPKKGWIEDPASDFGRISRQQDFLRRTLVAALAKGVMNPSVARALIQSAQKYVVFEQGFTIDDMLKFVGVLRDIDPNTIATYQVEGSRLIISGQDVLKPQIKGANMQAILAIFRGEAALAAAPTQVFETTTTAAGTATTASATTTTTGTGTVTSSPPTAPAENTKGILPPKDVQC